ncbi:hypothetical protein DPMN_094626 [Dreissena polymorpha]|uniref:Uncharacterized protein n=1 Tax=Dreissena polymorpha TaxID=45954 RepID=A0A9D4L5E2_DREPO|nr:hypothetical protein DPMN_094626 [Dreissena polymorpha]
MVHVPGKKNLRDIRQDVLSVWCCLVSHRIQIKKLTHLVTTHCPACTSMQTILMWLMTSLRSQLQHALLMLLFQLSHGTWYVRPQHQTLPFKALSTSWRADFQTIVENYHQHCDLIIGLQQA